MSEQSVVLTAVDRITAEALELTELARTGVPGRVRVLDVRELWPVGVLAGRLSVQVAGGASYPASFPGPFTAPAVARVQDGGTFDARIDPQRPDRVYVDWLG